MTCMTISLSEFVTPRSGDNDKLRGNAKSIPDLAKIMIAGRLGRLLCNTYLGLTQLQFFFSRRLFGKVALKEANPRIQHGDRYSYR